MAKKASKKKVTKKASATKLCAKCRKRKPLGSFGVNEKMKSGRKSYCKGCSRAAQRAWNEKNRKSAKKASRKKASRKKAARVNPLS